MTLQNLFWFIVGCNVTAWFCLALLYFALPYREWIFLDDELPKVSELKKNALYRYDKQGYFYDGI